MRGTPQGSVGRHEYISTGVGPNDERNAIVGWLSMLRRPEVMSSAGTPKAWAAIDRNTEALTGLIEDLLDVSRIATGKLRLAETDADLNEIVRDSVRTMEPKFQEKGVALSVAPPAAACRVRASTSAGCPCPCTTDHQDAIASMAR